MSMVLILTASIEPNGMTMLRISDPQVRLGQYLAAFRYWLHVAAAEVTNIVFVENSGADLTPFRQLVDSHNPFQKAVELISLNQNDFPRGLGKGYGEFRMLDTAVSQSKLIATAPFFAKATGRLVIRNLPQVIRALPVRYRLICDAFLLKTDPTGGRIDSRLIFFSREFYLERVMGLYQQMDDSAGYFAEHALFHLMQTDNVDPPLLFTRLPRQPKWHGFSASTGEQYGRLIVRVKWPLAELRRRAQRLTGYPSLGAIRRARGRDGMGTHACPADPVNH